MKNLSLKISILLVLAIVNSACKKEEIQPIGFYEVNYYTKTDQDQEFLYYYDDGQAVAGSLDEYMVSVNSAAGTFSDEQLLLLKFKTEIDNLPDSLVPYTYFVGLNYNGELNNPLSLGLNIDYSFNNNAHSDYLENEFFKQNISGMQLVKLAYEGIADVYYDPDFALETIPFEFDTDKNDVLFETDDLNAMYALCWVENKWSDTLNFNLSGVDGNTQEVIQEGYRSTPVNAEGGAFRGTNLEFHYSPKSRKSIDQTNGSGWSIYDLQIKVQNPTLGMLDPDDVEISLLLSKDDGSLVYTYLEKTASTTFEVTELPQVNSYGKLHIGGTMRLQLNQTNLSTDLEINFMRQR